MPITIRELVIRTIITDPGERGGDGESLGGATTPSHADDVDGLIQECVTQVMERLREQDER